MFTKLSTLALALPLVSALTFNSVSNTPGESSITVTWTADSSDAPYFSLELVNQADFHNTYALANNVQTSLGSITFQLPEVEPDSYQIEAIATNDINQVLATSNTFSITSGSSSSASAASTSSGTSTGSTSTVSSSTASATTPSATASTTSPPLSSTAVVASTASSSSASSTPSSFSSSGAASLNMAGVVPAAALVLSAVAGAVMVF